MDRYWFRDQHLWRERKGISTYFDPTQNNNQGANIINGVSNWKKLDSMTTTFDGVTTTENYVYDEE